MHQKYLDQGYLTLPVKPRSKASALKAGYSLYEWATEGMSEELIQSFDENYPLEKGYGVALICGIKSGVIAVDMDTDDKNVHDIIPWSPCEKVGKQSTRFFRYSDAFKTKINIGKNEGKLKDHVEILTSGQYCILPPSIHPDTKKAYYWTSEENLLWIPSEELPELDPLVVEELTSYYNRKYKITGAQAQRIDFNKIHVSDESRCPHGSHDRLKQLAATLIRHERPIDEAIRELYDYDNENHTPTGYFLDKTRGADSRLDPETNAARFYVQQLQFINAKRMREGEEPHRVITPDIVLELPDGGEFKVNVSKLKPYPKTRGSMALVQEYIELVTPFKQDAISLGAALSLMSILCANKFRTHAGSFDIRPNLYVLNLAKSGAGKETAQSLVMDLISGTKMLGSGGYKSGTSIVKGLPDQQERLNVIDEAGAWLKSIGNGEGFQQEMNDILSGIFTRSNAFYPGLSFAGERGDKLGACWNPSLSILASTTVHAFKSSVNQSMGAKGLMPRFLTFWQHSLGKYKIPKRSDILKASEIKKQITSFVKLFLMNEKRLHPDFDMGSMITVDLEASGEEQVQNFGKRYDPVLIPMTDEAEDRYFQYAMKKAPPDTLQDAFDDPFLNRHAELAGKVALLDAASRGAREIDLECMGWAIGVVDVCWQNSEGLFQHTAAENVTEKNVLRILDVIKSCKEVWVSKKHISDKTNWLKPHERDQVLGQLIDSEKIERTDMKLNGSRKASKVYKAL